jgi:hypothetical protein
MKVERKRERIVSFNVSDTPLHKFKKLYFDQFQKLLI